MEKDIFPENAPRVAAAVAEAVEDNEEEAEDVVAVVPPGVDSEVA